MSKSGHTTALPGRGTAGKDSDSTCYRQVSLGPATNTMPLLYAVVSRGTCVLAEHSCATAGNAADVAMNIISKTASVDSRLSYSQERHLFHLLCEDGLIFLCMADEVFGRRIPYVFLEDVQARFMAMHSRHATQALRYAFQEEFSPILAQQMEYFSTDDNADTVSRVRGEILDVKRGMVENIDKILDRGDTIELLVDKAGSLQGDAFKFKKHTRTLRKKFWWQNVYYLMAIVFLLSMLIYGAVVLGCGWAFEECRHR